MDWTDICNDPTWKDLPYKIQTDKWGNIMMTPATNRHGMYQAKVVALMSRLMDTGTIVSECSVQTKEGVKVADVAWASDEFMHRNGDDNPFDEAPEVCVEILSPSNSQAEMTEKMELYFARGAKELWICDVEGNMKFYKSTGMIGESSIIEGFPARIVIDRPANRAAS